MNWKIIDKYYDGGDEHFKAINYIIENEKRERKLIKDYEPDLRLLIVGDIVNLERRFKGESRDVLDRIS